MEGELNSEHDPKQLLCVRGTSRHWLCDSSDAIQAVCSFTFSYERLIKMAASVFVAVCVYYVCVLLTSKVFPGGFPGSRRSHLACRRPGPGSPACGAATQKNRIIRRWRHQPISCRGNIFKKARAVFMFICLSVWCSASWSHRLHVNVNTRTRVKSSARTRSHSVSET